MALIKCPKCNHEISDTIKKCIHCGAKIEKKKAHIEDASQQKMGKSKIDKEIPIKVKKLSKSKKEKNNIYGKKSIIIISILSIIIIGLVSYIIIDKLLNKNPALENENTNINSTINDFNLDFSTPIVLIVSDHCIHCNNIKPTIEGIVKEYNLKYEEINIKDIQDDSEYKNINSFPTVIVTRKNGIRDTLIGNHPKSEILDFFNKTNVGNNMTSYIYYDFTNGTWSLNKIEEFCNQNKISLNVKYQKSTEHQSGAIISQNPKPESTIIIGGTLTVTIAE